MIKKIFSYSTLSLISVFSLSACDTFTYTKTVDASAPLSYEIPKNKNVTVVSTLTGNAQVENGQVYPFNPNVTNHNITEGVLSALRASGYSDISTRILPANNPLNQGNITTSGVDLSLQSTQDLVSNSITYLKQNVSYPKSNTIILVTNSPKEQVPFSVSCLQHKTKISVDYIIYIIDANTFKMLTWEQSKISVSQAKNSICQQSGYIAPQQINYALQTEQGDISASVAQTAQRLLTNTADEAIPFDQVPTKNIDKK